MTAQSVTSSRSLRQVLAKGIGGGVAFAAILTAFGQFGVLRENPTYDATETMAWLVEVAAAVVAAAVVWMTGKAGTVPGNLSGAANRALLFGILAAASFPVFWLGVYAVFAAGSFVLGGASVRQASGATRTKAAVGLGIAAIATVFCAMLNLTG